MTSINYNLAIIDNYLPGYTSLNEDPEEWISNLNRITDHAKQLLMTKVELDSDQVKMLSPDKVVTNSMDSYRFLFSRLLHEPISKREESTLERFLSECPCPQHIASQTDAAIVSAMSKLRSTVDAIYTIYLQTPEEIKFNSKWVKIEKEMISDLQEIFPRKKPNSVEAKFAHDIKSFFKHPIKSITSIPKTLIQLTKDSFKSLGQGDYAQGIMRAASLGLPAIGVGMTLFFSSISLLPATMIAVGYLGAGYLLHSVADVTWPQSHTDEIASATNHYAAQNFQELNRQLLAQQNRFLKTHEKRTEDEKLEKSKRIREVRIQKYHRIQELLNRIRVLKVSKNRTPEEDIELDSLKNELSHIQNDLDII